VPTFSSAATWDVDPAHSAAQFKVRHLMVSSVRGEFRKVTGTVDLNEKDITRSTVDVTIDSSTINTGEPKRDEHLKSADFFDVAKFPVLTFKSRKVQKAGDGKLKVTGDLTMHGVTREVVLDVEGPTAPVKDPWGNVKIGTSAATKLNRKDYGLTWNAAVESGGVVVGEEVAIDLDIELVKRVNKEQAAKK
jgi:polyisoprenoid-binding protein YceI